MTVKKATTLILLPGDNDFIASSQISLNVCLLHHQLLYWYIICFWNVL